MSVTALVDAVVLVDDIQFRREEGTQTEFFHLQRIYDSQKRIVLSSDCPPHEIPALEASCARGSSGDSLPDIQSPASK